MMEEREELARLLFTRRYARYYWIEAPESERDGYRADAQAILDAGFSRNRDTPNM